MQRSDSPSDCSAIEDDLSGLPEDELTLSKSNSKPKPKPKRKRKYKPVLFWIRKDTKETIENLNEDYLTYTIHNSNKKNQQDRIINAVYSIPGANERIIVEQVSKRLLAERQQKNIIILKTDQSLQDVLIQLKETYHPERLIVQSLGQPRTVFRKQQQQQYQKQELYYQLDNGDFLQVESITNNGLQKRVLHWVALNENEAYTIINSFERKNLFDVKIEKRQESYYYSGKYRTGHDDLTVVAVNKEHIRHLVLDRRSKEYAEMVFKISDVASVNMFLQLYEARISPSPSPLSSSSPASPASPAPNLDFTSLNIPNTQPMDEELLKFNQPLDLNLNELNVDNFETMDLTFNDEDLQKFFNSYESAESTEQNYSQINQVNNEQATPLIPEEPVITAPITINRSSPEKPPIVSNTTTTSLFKSLGVSSSFPESDGKKSFEPQHSSSKRFKQTSS